MECLFFELFEGAVHLGMSVTGHGVPRILFNFQPTGRDRGIEFLVVYEWSASILIQFLCASRLYSATLRTSAATEASNENASEYSACVPIVILNTNPLRVGVYCLTNDQATYEACLRSANYFDLCHRRPTQPTCRD